MDIRRGLGMITLPLCHKNSAAATTLPVRIAGKCGREGKRAALIGDQARAAPLPRFAKTRRHRSNLLAGSSLSRCAVRMRVGAPAALPECTRVVACAEPARARAGREPSYGWGTHR